MTHIINPGFEESGQGGVQTFLLQVARLERSGGREKNPEFPCSYRQNVVLGVLKML